MGGHVSSYFNPTPANTGTERNRRPLYISTTLASGNTTRQFGYIYDPDPALVERDRLERQRQQRVEPPTAYYYSCLYTGLKQDPTPTDIKNQHCTIHFYGKITPEDLDARVRALRELDLPEMRFEAGKPAVFGDRSGAVAERPHVLQLELLNKDGDEIDRAIRSYRKAWPSKGAVQYDAWQPHITVSKAGPPEDEQAYERAADTLRGRTFSRVYVMLAKNKATGLPEIVSTVPLAPVLQSQFRQTSSSG